MTREIGKVWLARACALLALACALGACSRPPKLVQQESYVFGTRVEVLVYGESEDKAKSAAAAVLREFDRLHHMLHAWKPSELTTLNEAIARGEARNPVSEELADILTHAQQVAAQGGERFDPAIGQLIALWGFQSDEFKPLLPPADKVAELVAARPRMADLVIARTPAGATVGSRNPAVKLDLGGYAKGYALDRAAAILKQQGVSNALINIGGNVMALGSKGGTPWRVGIQHPRSPQPLASLELADGEAIGTSGDYQRYFELDGKRYCHLLDPATGQPANGAKAVSVLITPRPRAGALSDATSKPLFIAGPGEWRALAHDMGVEHALRVEADGRIRATRALAGRLTLSPGIALAEILD